MAKTPKDAQNVRKGPTATPSHFLDQIEEMEDEKLVKLLTTVEGAKKLRAANEMDKRSQFSGQLGRDYKLIQVLKAHKKLTSAAKASAEAAGRKYRSDSDPIATILITWRGLSSSVACKRAGVFGEAIRQKLTGSQMLRFVNDNGGFEKASQKASILDAARQGILWVSIGRSENEKFFPIAVYTDHRHIKKVRKLLKGGKKPQNISEEDLKLLSEILSEIPK